MREEGGGVREGRGERGERERERRSHFARGRGRVGAGRHGPGANQLPLFLRFLIPALRDSRAKNYAKKFFADGATWGKIRKNPNKIGVFGVKKKIA